MPTLPGLLLTSLCVNGLVLQEEVRRELDLLGFSLSSMNPAQHEVLDVAIIGGGQTGLGLCFSLQKHGIYNVAVFDSAVEGLEGPWLTTARMEVLRTRKALPGLGLGIPSLTFRSWYEATYQNWDLLNKIPTRMWAEYLYWYRKVLDLPVKNEWRLISILPEGNFLKLVFSGERELRARKVILATGRSGFGGFEIPSFVQDLPKSLWFHTGEQIDPKAFQGKRICVIGNGASAFDIAATALENGAIRVDMTMRHSEVPIVNVLANFPYWPAFYSLSNEEKIRLFQTTFEMGIPPPAEALARMAQWDHFHLYPQMQIEQVTFQNDIQIQTNREFLQADLLILATGYAVDPQAVPEISMLADQILYWRDMVDEIPPKLGRFPYLGENFEFLEKNPGCAPYLKQIHCFNYGAFLSHGRTAGDIDQMCSGIERLAARISMELFLSNLTE